MYIAPNKLIKRNKRYNNFIVGRPGYWGGLFILVVLTMMAEGPHPYAGEILIVLAVSQLILTAARCRDAGLNGWWCLVAAIPLSCLYFGCIRNDDHPKKLRPFEKIKANTNKLRINNQSGFTLLELMATVVLLFVIVIFATPWYGAYVHRAKVAHTIGDIGEIHLRVAMFDLTNSRNPTSLAEINLDGQLDPWGNPYQYLSFDNIESNGPKRKNRAMVPVNTFYDVYSIGPDGESESPFTSVHSRDDVVMAMDGAFFGEVGDFE